MIAGVSGIYDEPELYELACAYRDIPAEATVLLTWCAIHFRRSAGEHTDSGVRSVLELAAGPAEHARELARRGLRAATLDLSPAMCGYAAAQAKAAGVDLQVVQGDMRGFVVTGPGGTPVLFDAAITMLNSVCHLFTLDDLVRHLTAVRANLVPGGLYIVELAHPADFFGSVPRTSSEWTTDAPGVHADVHWGGRTDQIDPLTQVTKEHMTITAAYDDGTIRIAATSGEAARAAIDRIESLTRDVQVGEIYEGKVARLMDFGAFVTILPGKDGLVHISQISEKRVENVADELKEGQVVRVKVLEIDKQGRIRLSMKAVAESA